MDLRLQGKRALVTGSSIGLGEAIARALAAEGVAVAIHGRQPERTFAVAAEIEAHGGRTAVVLGDLTVEDEAHNIANSAIEQLGGIDILVNNAGGPGDRLFWEKTQIRAWTESYDRNVLAAVRLINHLLPPMRESSWGRIVNVSSVAGVMPQPTGPEYGASKAAINNPSLSLTKALGASGVTVNTVSPGMIHTPKLEIQLRQIATTKGWVANGASWSEIERLFLKFHRCHSAELVALRRSRTPLSSCVARLPVTSPERICELMAALYQLYRAVLTLRRTTVVES